MLHTAGILLPAGDEFLFGRPVHPLDPALPAQRLMPVFIAFQVHHLHRQAGPGILGAVSAVMRFQPGFRVRCPAAVKAPVRTAEQIDIVHDRLFFHGCLPQFTESALPSFSCVILPQKPRAKKYSPRRTNSA